MTESSTPRPPNPPSALRRAFVYETSRWTTGFIAKLLFGYRVDGKENWPVGQGGLVCSNHQSLIDPIILGLSYPGRLNYLARESLFRVPAFRWVIESLQAIPIKRDGLGIGGLKEALRRLKRDEKVLIFPEGTRTPDGEIQPFQPGFLAIARRGKVPVIPIGFDGGFAAWPRNRRFPRLSTIRVCIGAPFSAEEISESTDDELMAALACRISDCHERARLWRIDGELPDIVD